ncbi:ABC transporter substrate-binding protein [Marinobacter nauticus]
MKATPDIDAQRQSERSFAWWRVWICSVLVLLWQPALTFGQSAGATEVYVAGSGNDALDQYVIRQIKQNVGPAFNLTPLSSRKSLPDNHAPVLAIGPQAFSRVLQQDAKQPVLALLVKKSLVKEYEEKPGSQIGAVYKDVPLIRQALTGKVILPQATRIALLASTESADLYEPLLEQLEAFNLEARVFITDTNEQLIPTLNRALSYGDFLLAADDEAIYNPRNIKHILLTAYRRNKILIGPNQSYVKAGSLASSYTPFPDMARQAAEALIAYRETGQLPAPAYPDQYRVQVNEQVARSLNIPLPARDDIADTVDQILLESREGSQ